MTKHLLEVKNLQVGYDGKAILPPISFEMESTTKLWLRGTNGLGKTTILKTIMKKRLPAIGGSFNFNINSKINYIEQDYRNSHREFNKTQIKDLGIALSCAFSVLFSWTN